jgi:transcription elongation factor GreB
MESAEVVDPAQQKNRDRVFFGATVTYANDRDEEKTVTIVGIDEADLAQGRISWISPVARALLKAQVGDVVEVRTPAGGDSLEVIEIRYPEPENPVSGAT